jgi:hypothetical protein
MHFPGNKEWLPVDIRAKQFKVKIVKYFGAGECGGFGDMLIPVNIYFFLQRVFIGK